MKKFLFTFLALFALGFAAHAEEPLNVRVVPKAGDVMIFKFTQKPEMAFLVGNLSITTLDSDPVSFEFNEIDHIDFIKSSEVGNVMQPESIITVTTYPAAIVFGNVPEKSTVAVYNMQGQQVALAKAEGEYVLDRSGLARGVYIVKINDVTFKVVL